MPPGKESGYPMEMSLLSFIRRSRNGQNMVPFSHERMVRDGGSLDSIARIGA
ncbi:hypothetical protein PBS_12470 [Paraburkholderia sp. 2C]